MNNKSRENLNENNRQSLGGGEWISTPRFVNIKRFKSVGFSPIFIGTSKIDGRNGIKAGDTIYFKANNKRGINSLGRTDESMGSCEDLGEVFGYYMLRGYAEKLGGDAVLVPTVYDFSEYSNDDFWKIIADQTARLVESSRFYGCVTKHCLDEGADIMHGHLILGQFLDKNNAFRSGNNSLINYEKGLAILAEKMKGDGQELVIDPMCTRYLANVMFWDYFYSNSDRHCKNITFQTVPLGDGKVLFKPTPVLDNGGGLALQSPNCLKTYTEQIQSINENGKMVEFIGGIKNSFDCTLDFFIGKESFVDEAAQRGYDDLKYVEQLALMLSQNKVLFNDFKNMYSALDTDEAFAKMKTETRFRADFLPGFDMVAKETVRYKREKISRVFANMMNVEFDEQAFAENQTKYIDMFEPLVAENNLNLFIATDEQRKAFNKVVAERLEAKKVNENS